MPSRPYTLRGRTLLALRQAGQRQCEKCGNVYILNRSHFYTRDSAGNLMYVCKGCHKARVRARELERKG